MAAAASLSAVARGVLRRAVEAYRDHPETVRWLHDQLERIDAPLRVAVAGQVKAGKSTLLNALVGEMMAATDAAECTRVVTWYSYSDRTRLMLHTTDGQAHTLPVTRRGGKLIVDLGGTAVDDVDRIMVDWPSQSLRPATLIDTPGIGSMTTENSARSTAFLVPEDAPTPADAVLYLMRHLHATDLGFLEAFGDRNLATAAAVNAIGVLSRADEIGAGRLDALSSARRIAGRYRGDPRLQGLCQDVVAVAGLLAQAGRSLRQDEFQAFQALAAAERQDTDAMMLSADRFLGSGSSPDDILPLESRGMLMERFGIFGVRLATMLVRQGRNSPQALAGELIQRSGLRELQDTLTHQFTERRDLLKARSALLGLDSVLRQNAPPQARPLLGEVERILSGAHEFAELRLLTALRSATVTLPADYRTEAEQLLGAGGTSPQRRLGLDGSADPDTLREAGLDALDRWRRRSENPVLSRGARDAARTVVRSCEGMLHTLTDR